MGKYNLIKFWKFKKQLISAASSGNPLSTRLLNVALVDFTKEVVVTPVKDFPPKLNCLIFSNIFLHIVRHGVGVC